MSHPTRIHGSEENFCKFGEAAGWSPLSGCEPVTNRKPEIIITAGPYTKTKCNKINISHKIKMKHNCEALLKGVVAPLTLWPWGEVLSAPFCIRRDELRFRPELPLTETRWQKAGSSVCPRARLRAWSLRWGRSSRMGCAEVPDPGPSSPLRV